MSHFSHFYPEHTIRYYLSFRSQALLLRQKSGRRRYPALQAHFPLIFSLVPYQKVSNQSNKELLIIIQISFKSSGNTLTQTFRGI